MIRWTKFNIALPGLLILALSGCAGLRDAPFVLRDDRVEATIVIADTPTAIAEEAAEILRDTIARMTGHTLAIVPEREAPGEGSLLVVGASGIAADMGIEIPHDPWAPDRYVIRRRGRVMALAGNDGGNRKGTMYAVFDLLQRWGCGWYAPDPDWHVIPSVNRLRIPDLDVEETAAFDSRRIRAIPAGTLIGRAWRLGGAAVREEYTLNTLAPRTLRAEHPEWFDAGQPDICHPELIAHVLKQLKTRLESRQTFLQFDLRVDDTHGWPDTRYTRAIGNPGAQWLYFANRLADGLRPSHQGRFIIGIHVAGLTHRPPDGPLDATAPEVVVFIGHESNLAKPWDAPDSPDMLNFYKNHAWIRGRFHGWRDTGVNLGIQDYWKPGVTYEEWRDLPWVALETTVRNTRYWHRHEVRYIDVATDTTRHDDWLIRWPLYYIGARAQWNPSLDPVQALQQACDRLFGPAASMMFAYYKTLDGAMSETPYFHQNRHLPPAQKVYTPEIRSKARHYLDAAMERAGDDARIAARITRESEHWEKAAKILDTLARMHYRAYVDDKFMLWHEPEATVGTIRRLFGIPGYRPLYVVQPDTRDPATALEKAATIDVINLIDGDRLVTEPSRKPTSDKSGP